MLKGVYKNGQGEVRNEKEVNKVEKRKRGKEEVGREVGSFLGRSLCLALTL